SLHWQPSRIRQPPQDELGFQVGGAAFPPASPPRPTSRSHRRPAEKYSPSQTNTSSAPVVPFSLLQSLPPLLVSRLPSPASNTRASLLSRPALSSLACFFGSFSASPFSWCPCLMPSCSSSLFS